MKYVFDRFLSMLSTHMKFEYVASKVTYNTYNSYQIVIPRKVGSCCCCKNILHLCLVAPNSNLISTIDSASPTTLFGLSLGHLEVIWRSFEGHKVDLNSNLISTCLKVIFSKKDMLSGHWRSLVVISHKKSASHVSLFKVPNTTHPVQILFHATTEVAPLY